MGLRQLRCDGCITNYCCCASSYSEIRLGNHETYLFVFEGMLQNIHINSYYLHTIVVYIIDDEGKRNISWLSDVYVLIKTRENYKCLFV